MTSHPLVFGALESRLYIQDRRCGIFHPTDALDVMIGPVLIDELENRQVFV